MKKFIQVSKSQKNGEVEEITTKSRKYCLLIVTPNIDRVFGVKVIERKIFKKKYRTMYEKLWIWGQK